MSPASLQLPDNACRNGLSGSPIPAVASRKRRRQLLNAFPILMIKALFTSGQRISAFLRKTVQKMALQSSVKLKIRSLMTFQSWVRSPRMTIFRQLSWKQIQLLLNPKQVNQKLADQFCQTSQIARPWIKLRIFYNRQKQRSIGSSFRVQKFKTCRENLTLQ